MNQGRNQVLRSSNTIRSTAPTAPPRSGVTSDWRPQVVKASSNKYDWIGVVGLIGVIILLERIS